MPFLEECKIIDISPLAGGVFSMRLEAPEIACSACPGQFVGVSCGADTVLRRPFAVCDANGTRLRIVFETRGKGTVWLSHRKPGDLLSVLGPLGNGFMSPENGKVLLAAGGVGAAPLLFAAHALGTGADAALGFRSKDTCILLDDYIVSCGKTLVTSDDGSIGDKGFTHELCEKMLAEEKYSQILTCGPPRMMEAVAQIAAKYNIPCQVSLEERMGCGVGACLVCACKIKDGGGYKHSHVCKDGPVFDSREVCWDE